MNASHIHFYGRLSGVGLFIDHLKIAEEERMGVSEQCAYLSDLYRETRRFYAAVRLFDLVESTHSAEHEWKLMAGREGAWAIYNFGQVLKFSIAGFRGAAPKFYSKIDINRVRAARKKFVKFFPIRDALAHMPEINQSPESRERNYYKGEFRSDGMIVEGDTLMLMNHSFYGRTFQIIFKQKLMSYELSESILNELVEMKDECFQGVLAAVVQ